MHTVCVFECMCWQMHELEYRGASTVHWPTDPMCTSSLLTSVLPDSNTTVPCRGRWHDVQEETSFYLFSSGSHPLNMFTFYVHIISWGEWEVS